MLAVAIEEARQGLAEGGIPIGAALFERGICSEADIIWRIQENDPSIHGETTLFAKPDGKEITAIRYGDDARAVWYCSGLVRQFNTERLSSANR